jgi:predicted GH43/DUF377 family glycosyl hydrolase
MSVKIRRAIKMANVFKGTSTIAAIMEQVPEQLINNLSSKDLAVVIEAINKAYHKGRVSTGAEMIDTNCVWINGLDKMIEWTEEGAEYKRESFKEISKYTGFIMTGTRPVKIKDGELVPRFC